MNDSRLSMYVSHFKFGATTLGDAGFDLSWDRNMGCVIGAAISSKTTGTDFKNLLMKHRKKVIYRPIISGLGGTKVEPGIPKQGKVLAQIEELLDRGFPAKQIVPQITPLLPLAWRDKINLALEIDYLENLRQILKACREMGITRIFHSFLMMNPKVISAFTKINNGLALDPYSWYFNPYNEIALNVMDESFQYETSDTFYPYAKMNYMISNDDLAVLGLQNKYRLINGMDQFRNIVQLINPFENGTKNCMGMCITCPYGNIKRYNPL